MIQLGVLSSKIFLLLVNYTFFVIDVPPTHFCVSCVPGLGRACHAGAIVTVNLKMQNSQLHLGFLSCNHDDQLVKLEMAALQALVNALREELVR